MIRKRHVFYVPGFDPRSVGFYYKLFRSEAAKQAEVSGLALTVGRRQPTSPVSTAWSIGATDAGHKVEATYEFLKWDDLVRQTWPQSHWALWWSTLRFLWFYIFSGVVITVGRLSPIILVAGLYPVFYVLFTWLLMLGVIIGGILFAWASHVVIWIVATAVVGVVVATIVVYGRRLADKWNVFWLLRCNDFSAHYACGDLPNIENRLDAFADRIQSVLAEDAIDEVVLIGHSIGTQLVVPILHRLMVRGVKDARLKVMTLGNCVPLVSLLSVASGYRKLLAEVGKADIVWYDVSSPIDGACFVLTNPVTSAGIELAENKGPRVVSARFHTLFTAQTYQKLRKDWYRVHFQYLMASELVGDYDYFAIIGGAKSLSQRLSALESKQRKVDRV